MPVSGCIGQIFQVEPLIFKSKPNLPLLQSIGMGMLFVRIHQKINSSVVETKYFKLETLCFVLHGKHASKAGQTLKV